jgi:hypothetical protein
MICLTVSRYHTKWQAGSEGMLQLIGILAG